MSDELNLYADALQEEVNRLRARLAVAKKYMRHLDDCCINFENSLEALEGLCDCGLDAAMAADSAGACKHGSPGPCGLCAQEDAEHDGAMAAT